MKKSILLPLIITVGLLIMGTSSYAKSTNPERPLAKEDYINHSLDASISAKTPDFVFIGSYGSGILEFIDDIPTTMEKYYSPSLLVSDTTELNGPYEGWYEIIYLPVNPYYVEDYHSMYYGDGELLFTTSLPNFSYIFRMYEPIQAGKSVAIMDRAKEIGYLTPDFYKRPLTQIVGTDFGPIYDLESPIIEKVVLPDGVYMLDSFPMTLYRYDFAKQKLVRIYQNKDINYGSSLVTDGQNVYFSYRDEKEQLHYYSYNLKTRKTTSIPSLDNFQYLGFELVRLNSTDQAWKVFEQKFDMMGDHFFVYRNKLYFYSKKNKTSNINWYYLDMKTGKITKSNLTTKTLATRAVINTLDDYLILFDENKTEIVNLKNFKDRYFFEWGLKPEDYDIRSYNLGDYHDFAKLRV